MSSLLYVDMDGVLADYEKRAKKLSEMSDGDTQDVKWHHKEARFYLKLDPIEGAKEAFDKLRSCDQYEVHILSQPSWTNANCWTDKRLWVERHLGEKAKRRLTLTHDKSLLKGDILIDDKLENAEGFDSFIHFGSEEWPSWDKVLSHLL